MWFLPFPTYSTKLNVNVVDDDYIEVRSENLRMELADGVALISQAISKQDFPALNEREVYIFGTMEPSFEEFFHEHPGLSRLGVKRNLHLFTHLELLLPS